MELIIQKIFAASFLVWGISHMIQPQLWIDFFTNLSQKKYGGLVVALYTLPVGLLLLTCHNVWEWSPAVFVTIAGWSMTIKGIIYALFPQSFNRLFLDLPAKRSSFQMGGAIAAFFSVWILLRFIG